MSGLQSPLQIVEIFGAGLNPAPEMYNMAMPTILIIEDEQELVRVLRSYLEQAGFKF